MNINKLITKILKESNVDAKITKDINNPKFRVVNNQLTLEGVIKNTKANGTSYSMSIKDRRGEVIDELTVSVKDGNDVANRINESINTLNKLSPIYDNHMKLKEDEEFEELPEAEPGDTYGALKALDHIYDVLMELADETEKITDYFDDDEAEGKQEIISYVAAIYDLAMDISDYKQDTIDAMAEAKSSKTDESLKPRKNVKVASNIALNNITVAEAALRGHKNYNDIQQALKNIRTELTIRNK